MKYLYTIFLATMGFCSLQAQSLKELFLKMPQESCPALSEYNRLELVDNLKNGKPMQTYNLFRTISTMKVLTDDYAHLVISLNSEKELKLLPLNDGSHIIMVLSTIYSDSIADSSLSFYTTDWQFLDANNYISNPTSSEFRRISIDPISNHLTILTSYPFAISKNGNNQSTEMNTKSKLLMWNPDQNQFIVN